MKLPLEVADYLLQWKCQYGSVFVTTIDTQLVVYRGLNLQEFNALSSYTKIDETAEMNIVKACLLYPLDLHFEKSLSWTVLCNQIRENSMWESKDEDTLPKAMQERRKLRGEYHIWAVKMAQTLGMKIEDVEAMTFDKFVDYCILFEIAIGKELFKPKASKQEAHTETLGRLGVTEDTIPAEAVSAHQLLAEKIAMDKAALAKGVKLNTFSWLQDQKEIQGAMSSELKQERLDIATGKLRRR